MNFNLLFFWSNGSGFTFSVFDLQRQQLQLESTTGTTQLIDLTRTNENILSLLLADDLNYVELLYDLAGSNLDPLARFSGDSEMIFSIGAEEKIASITPGGVVMFENPDHLSLLDGADYLTIQLYLNNDSSNVLWEFAFGNGLNVISSSNVGSKAAKSFVIRGTEDPIKVQWLTDLESTDKIQWKIEALSGLKNPNVPDDLGSLTDADKKKIMYGKIQAQSFLGGNAGGTGTGQFGAPWLSDVRTAGTNAQQVPLKEIWFRPDMSGEPHPAYGVSEDGLSEHKGTKKTDVWRRNPKVGYKVTFILNGNEQASATIRLDEIDVLRQEFVNHAVSANTNYVGFPDREKFEIKTSLPAAGEWGSSGINEPYAYQYVLEDGMVRMWNSVSSAFTTHRQNQYNNLNVPSNALSVSSAFRNPERNERVGGATQSKHMMGRALDFYFTGSIGLPSLDRGILFGSLWDMTEGGTGISAQADFWQLESGTVAGIQKGDPIPPDNNNNDVPDLFESQDHLHIQDNP